MSKKVARNQLVAARRAAQPICIDLRPGFEASDPIVIADDQPTFVEIVDDIAMEIPEIKVPSSPHCWTHFDGGYTFNITNEDLIDCSSLFNSEPTFDYNFDTFGDINDEDLEFFDL